MDIAIIDYGLGNIKSIQNMMALLGTKCFATKNPAEIRNARKLILPGVGAFDEGVANLRQNGLIEVLSHEVLVEKKNILGICLGMQLMTEKSEEGSESGLGWFKARTKRFGCSIGEKMKVPHMGWNEVCPVSYRTLFKNFEDSESRFYFVHSYYVECDDRRDVLASCVYGEEFACAIAKENIYGVQFHPEKSHKFGMKLLKNFAEL
ncbi:MAG: Imidazole glycerol phosphate synthase amidotransferase subunit HisH [Candidatus Rifleibacterium amylolyticum]|nr:MAG: Imidazole glycerol phosphate synthase amidotransferase subunit HisH [Candidatus Rifleibacterium amylolyticum]